jgi:arginine decarboxylase
MEKKVIKKKRKKQEKRKKFRKFWKLGIEEFNTQYFSISRDHELVVREGNYQYNIFDLVQKFGSPLEVAFPFIVEKRYLDLVQTFNYHIKDYGYKGRFFYHYPMKVNQNKEVVLPLISEGANLETGSYNELWLVRKLWEQDQFDSRIRVICNGPKTDRYLGLVQELKEKGLSIIPIIEDLNEYEALKKYRGDVGVRVKLDLRVKSRWDKKNDRYGLSADDIYELGRIKNLKLLHYHIGSQTMHKDDIVAAVKKAIGIYIKIKKSNPSLDTLDIGGGLAIPYEKKKHYNPSSVVKSIISVLKKTCDKEGISHPNIICEWGRYMVAPAQITIFKVLCEKPIDHGIAKNWYIIDGSFMNDLIDTWAIHQKWHIVPVNNLRNEKLTRVWLAGSSCDSDDRYTAGGGYILLPRLEDLDSSEYQYIALFDSGAYQDSLASHHCLLSSPAKIIAQNGVLTVARRRESPEEVGKMFGW